MTPGDLIKSHFRFLEDQYAFVCSEVPSDRWDRTWLPSVGYAKSTVGVLVQYEVRDAYLSVLIFELQGGVFPLRAGRIATALGLPLNSVIFLSDAQAMIHSWTPAEPTLDGYVADAARKLRVHADDLLRGDFQRRDAIEAATAQILAARTASLP